MAARDPRTACATVTGSDVLLVAHRGQQKQCTESKQHLKLGVNMSARMNTKEYQLWVYAVNNPGVGGLDDIRNNVCLCV